MPTRKAFTLIELLVVISIISLLGSLVLGSLASARIKTRDAQRHREIQQIKNALELYYATNKQYPSGSWLSSNNANWATLQTALSPFISKLPIDPKQTAGNPWTLGVYTYGYFSLNYGCPNQWYMLVYELEQASGPDPGVIACDGSVFRYGGAGANTAKKTVGIGR